MHELEKVADRKHMEQVTYLKDEFGIGHGHANALVGWFREHGGA